MQTREQLAHLIDVAAGRIPADTVIKNCKIVDVYAGEIVEGDIALCGDQIAGIGSYEGRETVDARGMYAAPGFIDTDMTAVLPEAVRAGMTQGIPAGRAGQPEDVAQAVAFFAAEQSSYLTGQVLCVDGGMAM